jgi:hypothetical protein
VRSAVASCNIYSFYTHNWRLYTTNPSKNTAMVIRDTTGSYTGYHAPGRHRLLIKQTCSSPTHEHELILAFGHYSEPHLQDFETDLDLHISYGATLTNLCSSSSIKSGSTGSKYTSSVLLTPAISSCLASKTVTFSLVGCRLGHCHSRKVSCS